MPSNSVARVCVLVRPMLSYAWLTISFCIAGWLIGSPAIRSAPTRYTHMAVVGHPQTRVGMYPIRASSAITIRSQHRAMSLPPATA